MSAKGNKFGTFKGVFTPSILTILGVIMYLRLPWIVGEAGLIATLGIILIAHLISVSTGLSVASIATDKRVETGGTYFMISRSLGLPIGGTLGLALFVGLSFSVSLYLIGFSETLLTAFGIETSLNNIRITGALTLLGVTILTFISTSLALKTQFVILIVMALSLISIFFGRHELGPSMQIAENASEALPWIALFAVFFPAVTGFEAGVSMSGDLRNPKKSIPTGTIAAIVVGLVVYIGLAFFFSNTVSPDMLRDSSVLYKISLYAPLVVAGIWGATLSSALGSILGAPRILQATAIDRITPKIFANGYGASNEPRNALLLTFVIALAGIMIGDLNAIARIVTIFFIITYGFLNLTCAIENVAGADFRPSFRVPAWVGFTGALTCFVVMIQLDIIAMLGATLILGAVFLFLKRREITLQSGDTWGGIWSTLVKQGLIKLSNRQGNDKRNWRPNIILFSGGFSARPHLIQLGRIIVGKLGIFTNFELVENKTVEQLQATDSGALILTDDNGRKIFTRRHVCKDIYEGMGTISRVYGFTGFEPNTILMGWGKSTRDPDKFLNLIKQFHSNNFNLISLNYNEVQGFGTQKQIDLWWQEGSRNLNFAIMLLKFLTSDTRWRQARIRIMLVSIHNNSSEKAQTIIRQILDDQRMDADIRIIENNFEKKTLEELVKIHSASASLTLLDFDLGGKPDTACFEKLNSITHAAGTSLIIRANNLFEAVHTVPAIVEEIKEEAPAEPDKDKPFTLSISYPAKEILAAELEHIVVYLEKTHAQYVSDAAKEIGKTLKRTSGSLEELINWAHNHLEKCLNEKTILGQTATLSKLHGDFLFQAERFITTCTTDFLPAIGDQFRIATDIFTQKVEDRLNQVPEKIAVKYNRSEFLISEHDKLLTRIRKNWLRASAALFNKPVQLNIPVRSLMHVFLISKRKDFNHQLYQQLGVAMLDFLSAAKLILSETNTALEGMEKHVGEKHFADKALAAAKLKLSEMTEQLRDKRVAAVDKFKQEAQDELVSGLEKTSLMLGEPLAFKKLSGYEKVLSRQKYETESLDNLHLELVKNLELYTIRIKIELSLQSLKARLRTRLAKHLAELESLVESRISKNLERIKTLMLPADEKDEALKTPKIPGELVNIEPFDLRKSFGRFYKDIQSILAGLPSEVSIAGPQIFLEAEKGRFSGESMEVIDVQKTTIKFIGRDLINNLRIELGETEEGLNALVKNINDISRLAIFNLDNLADATKDKPEEEINEQRLSFISGTHQRIDEEQKVAENILKKTKTDVYALLDSSFGLLEQGILYDGIVKLAQQKKSFKIPWSAELETAYQSLKNFTHKIWVSAMYTRSEGLLLMKRFSSAGDESKKETHELYKLIENLAPNPAVVKQLPYYYANLFAGNSTINTSLWVGMKNQLNEAETAIRRFKAYRGGALLITGARNSGKSSLSRYLARDFSVDGKSFIVRAPQAGSNKESALYEAIMQAAGSTLHPNILLEIQPENQVYVFNDLELWWQRTPNGSDALTALFRLVEQFDKKHLFIVNCNQCAYDFLNRLYGIEKYFFAQIHCEPFDARELKEMIMLRHKAGGLKFRINKKDEDAFTEFDFARLFNRYFSVSGGNPGFVVRAWISNITDIQGKTIEIKQPQIPDTAALKSLAQEDYLLILQFVLHRRFDKAKLIAVMHSNEQDVNETLNKLLRQGIVEEKFNGVYALNQMLEPLLIDQLKERKLL